MSATASTAAPTSPTDLPVQLIGGPLGMDSPGLPQELPRFRWYAWIDLGDDRQAARRSPWPAIEWALGRAIVQQWPLWWLYPEAESWHVHVAQLAPVEGGGTMLLAACLRSAPWVGGPNYSVAERADTEPAANWERCPICSLAG